MNLFNKLNNNVVEALQLECGAFNITEEKFYRKFENEFKNLKISDNDKLIKDNITEEDIVNHVKRYVEIDNMNYCVFFKGTCEIIKRNNIILSNDTIKEIVKILSHTTKNEIFELTMLLRNVYNYSDDLIYKLVYKHHSVLCFSEDIGKYRQNLIEGLYKNLDNDSLKILNCILTAIEFNDPDVIYDNRITYFDDFSNIVDYIIQLGKEKENGKEIILKYLKYLVLNNSRKFDSKNIFKIMDSLNIDYNELLLNEDNMIVQSKHCIYINIDSVLNDTKKLTFIKKYINDICIKNNKRYSICITNDTPFECKFTDTLKDVTGLVEKIIDDNYRYNVQTDMTKLQFTIKIRRFFENNYDAIYMLKLLEKESSMNLMIDKSRFFGKLWKNVEHEEKTNTEKKLDNDIKYGDHFQKYYIDLINNGYFKSNDFKKLNTNDIVRIIMKASSPRDSYVSTNYDDKIISILSEVEDTEVYEEMILNHDFKFYLKKEAFFLNLQRSKNLEGFVKKYLAKSDIERRDINRIIFDYNDYNYDYNCKLMNAVDESKKHEIFDYGFLDIAPYIKELTEVEQISIAISNNKDLIKLLWNTKYDSVNNLMKMRK